MSNSSLPVDGGGGAAIAAVAAVGSSSNGGGGGGSGVGGVVVHNFASLCRNLTTTNGTKPGTATKAEEDTDFGAVLYIVVVLTFYSFGIVVMIVKYLKTEKKEMEEEMVLDSFFKGIPDKRIENEKQAVNRVAIQAFHTLTTSKQPRGLPQSSKDSSHDRRHTAANQHKKLLSPASYRRERYSIQPMYIGTSRQVDDDQISDDDDKSSEDNENDVDNTVIKHPGRCRVNPCTLEDENELGATCQRAESKPHKSVLFSDTVNPSPSRMKRNNVEDRGVRFKNKELRFNASSQFSLPSTSEYGDISEDNACSVSEIQLPLDKYTTGGNVSDTNSLFSNSSNSKTNRNVTAAGVTVPANTHNNSFENVPLNSPSSPRNKSSKNIGKSVLSTRKPPKGLLIKHPLDSPDLGVERNLSRIASLDKGIGDGSSYDSSSSLLTRIHLAETFTPPLRTKNRQDTRTNASASCLSSSRDDNSANCSSNVNYPFTIDTENSGDSKASDEKLKLTAGKNVSSMQPSYDSTSSSKGLTTRVNITEPSGDPNVGSRSCLVTDL